MSEFQSKFIREFNDAYREPFNDKLFERSDDDIIDVLKKIILSCQRSRYFILKVRNFTVIDDHATMMSILREQESIKTDSKNKSFNKYDYIAIKDSDVRLLVVDYYIKVPFPKDKKPGEKDLRVLILVPRFVDKYYFKIFGNYYCPKSQIVDGSTYNNATSRSKYMRNSFKSLFMATRVYQYTAEMNFTNGETKQGIFYNSNIFDKSVPAMKYILAKYGLYETLSLFGIPGVYLNDSDPDNENWYTLKKHNVYISMDKFIFDNDLVAQNLLYTMYLAVSSKDITPDVMRTDVFWLQSLGESYSNKTPEKGMSVLESLESIYDIPTKENLRLPEEHKKNIYSVLIWMLREFAAIYAKDNLDIAFKRLRLAEYIGGLYVLKISKGMFSFSNEGKNIQVDQIEQRIYTYPDYLLKVIARDRLYNNRNSVNENDAFNALKWSLKGVSGLGESKDASVPEGYKQVHPSHLGRIDLDSSSNNEPGVAGMLTPYAPMYDGYFSDFTEPDNWRDRVRDMLTEYNKVRGMKQVFTLQRSIGIVPDDTVVGMVEETIDAVENTILPFVIDVDESLSGTVKEN